MVPKVEFTVGDRVTYDNNKSVYKATVHKIILNPVDSTIEYHIVYRNDTISKGTFKAVVTGKNIKESSLYRGE